MRRSPLASEIRAFGPGRAPSPPDRPLPRTAGRIQDGRLLLEASHRDRLQASAPTAAWLPEAFRELLEALVPGGDGVLRIRLDEGGRQLWGLREPLPEMPQPYLLIPRPHPLARGDRPRVKGIDGAWSSALLAEARALGAADALLLWPDGTVAETAIAAVAVEAAGALVLPGAPGRVASLAEACWLPDWAQARGLALRREDLPFATLRGAKLWCLNAVRGVWPAELLPGSEPSGS